MYKIGICAVFKPHQTCPTPPLLERLWQQYLERCTLHTLLSDVRKHLPKQGNALLDFGICQDVRTVLKQCSEQDVRVLYLVQLHPPCVANASFDKICVRFL